MELRPPKPSDAPAVERLINASTQAEIGLVVYQPGDLLRAWQAGEPSEQHLVALAADGDLEGLLWVEDDGGGEIYFELYPRPGAPDDLSAALCDAVERRAEKRARATAKQVGLEVNSGQAPTTEFLEARGYRPGKTHLAMMIEMGNAPEPAWPEGVRPRAYREGEDDELFYRTLREGFGTEWDGPDDRDAWLKKHRAVGYVPELWFFAEGEEGVVGAVHSRDTWEKDLATGWVRNLAVLPAGRRRGVATALLLESFRRLARRGRRRVVLGVEERNIAARRLYEALGMRACGRSTDLFKTVLPPA